MKTYTNYYIYGIIFILVIIVILALFNLTRIDFNKVTEQNNIIYNEINNTNELLVLSSYTTQIFDDDKNRIHNIKLACNKLNGHIITPGTEFSFNDVLGTMDKKDGYKKAIGFDSNGNKIKMYGGGICQLSSTLYNAVLIANIKVTERHAHSRRVNYVPKNRDATVYYGGANLKFLNTISDNIVISASTDGTTVKVTLFTENNK